MKVLMDTDAVIKLTKSSLKELIVSNISVAIPASVSNESVREGKAKGYPDALLLEKNIRGRKINVVKAKKKEAKMMMMIKGLQLHSGEADCLYIFAQGSYDTVVSDDRKFLDIIDTIGIPFLTPSALVVYLYKSGKISISTANGCLEKLRAMISREEYHSAKDGLR
ncbi:MAG: hypothetical protein ACRD32_08735 [Nitrososphaerales archaeon]